MNNFFQRLNLELIRAGVWGRTSGMLKQELRDHYLTEKDALLVQGKSNEEADELALAKLGDPVQLAQQARMELTRRDKNFKTQFLLRFVPLCIGPLTVVTILCILWLAMEYTRPPAGWHLRLPVPQAFSPASNLFCTMILFYYLGPWLAAYLWILRASYRPTHSWRYLLLFSGYLTLSYYFCASRILITSDGVNLYFHPSFANGLISFLSLLLLITPWRVRAWKLKQGTSGCVT